MNFPRVKKLNVKNYYICLALSIKDFGGQPYVRKYYLVKYVDNSERVFLTTNEPDSDYNFGIIDEDFILVPSIERMLEDFENAELKNLVFETRFNGLPFYTYFDIILVDGLLKPLILKHLKESISGYTEDDFSDNEKKQLKLWMDCLLK